MYSIDYLPVNPSTQVQTLQGFPVGIDCPLLYSLPSKRQVIVTFSSEE